ncbi:unnamed protein product [Cyprideis torosa]|uniref:Protein adenylyltransferase Fic n=1 Tax=Cyprideis torosa TaxID=163714 RepID=A0A7R8WEL5_9CRUS|nr:unnamed protein product [Cyprideis torosa]CAG0893064.1 unnamed protein product [Cyprideis torosa]
MWTAGGVENSSSATWKFGLDMNLFTASSIFLNGMLLAILLLQVPQSNYKDVLRIAKKLFLDHFYVRFAEENSPVPRVRDLAPFDLDFGTDVTLRDESALEEQHDLLKELRERHSTSLMVKRSEEQQPGDGGSSETKCNEAHASLHAAMEMLGREKAEKADRLFRHALALCPDDPEVLTRYGEFLESGREVVEADKLYTRALLVCPAHSRALANKQRTYRLVDELDAAFLASLDAKKNRLLKIPKPVLRRIKKEAYFQHIYHSVGIEGNTMSLAQTRVILETRLAVGGKSLMEHNEIVGMDEALRYINTTLLHRLGQIQKQDILEIHRRVMGFVDVEEAGRLRRTQVFVGSHVPPKATEVEMLFDEFVRWLNSAEAMILHHIKFAALAHYKLVHLHPFVDGNGRTARLLMNWILMQGGYPPVIIRKQDRFEYYETLEQGNKGDVRPFMRFIARCADNTLGVYLWAERELGKEIDDHTAEEEDSSSYSWLGGHEGESERVIPVSSTSETFMRPPGG